MTIQQAYAVTQDRIARCVDAEWLAAGIGNAINAYIGDQEVPVIQQRHIRINGFAELTYESKCRDVAVLSLYNDFGIT